MWVRIFLSCLLVSSFVTKGDEMHGYAKNSKNSNRVKTSAEDDNKYYWDAVAQQELDDALNMVQNNNVAKNVILFLGDGMGVTTITSARIYDGQRRGERGEEGFLTFDRFPHVAMSKTYNVDFQVPDSAGTGTAYMTGSKTNRGVIGFDARVERGICEDITNDTIVHSIAQWSQDKGKSTGVVTTTRVTHATPASAYAHVPERDWECDAYIPAVELENCPFMKDIARQLVEDDPGRSLNVILAGGFQYLDGSATDQPGDPVEMDNCIREDGRVLWQEWLDDKEAEGHVPAFVRTRSQLLSTDFASTTHLMGIFTNDNMPYEYQKIEQGLDVPSIVDMTEAAITLLSQNPNGFFLLVEGGRIDHAHHTSKAKISLDETVAMAEAVQRALEMTNEEDTLIVVTADHSHTLTVNGYPERGNPITGFGGSGDDGIPYTTLSYANGPGYGYTVVDNEVVRPDPSAVNTSSWDYVSLGAVPRSSETHGGEDVVIYATGPMSHLFHSVHEQNYIPHVMAYASCVDPSERHCQERGRF